MHTEPLPEGRVWSCPSPRDPGQALLHGRPPASLGRWVGGILGAGTGPSPEARAWAGLPVAQAPGGLPSSYPSCTQSAGPPDYRQGSRSAQGTHLVYAPRDPTCSPAGGGEGRPRSQRLAGKQSLKRLSLNPDGAGAWGVAGRAPRGRVCGGCFPLSVQGDGVFLWKLCSVQPDPSAQPSSERRKTVSQE